jgi:hypothetical protein
MSWFSNFLKPKKEEKDNKLLIGSILLGVTGFFSLFKYNKENKVIENKEEKGFFSKIINNINSYMLIPNILIIRDESNGLIVTNFLKWYINFYEDDESNINLSLIFTKLIITIAILSIIFINPLTFSNISVISILGYMPYFFVSSYLKKNREIKLKTDKFYTSHLNNMDFEIRKNISYYEYNNYYVDKNIVNSLINLINNVNNFNKNINRTIYRFDMLDYNINKINSEKFKILKKDMSDLLKKNREDLKDQIFNFSILLKAIKNKITPDELINLSNDYVTLYENNNDFNMINNILEKLDDDINLIENYKKL